MDRETPNAVAHSAWLSLNWALVAAYGFVATVLAPRTGSVMQLAGQGAPSRLGLSTQVPARSVYLTDGPSRTLSLESRHIEFRNTSTRYLVEPGTTVGLVVQALRELGTEGADPEIVAHLQGTLAEGDLRRAAEFGVACPRGCSKRSRPCSKNLRDDG